MRKIILDISIFFHYLFRGLKNADAIAFEGKTSEAKEGVGAESTQESKSVYKDLLRGELTQEVKELRYEMYQAERASHNYVYNGNGTAVKKKAKPYEGVIENEAQDTLYIVQDNRETNGTLAEYGIYSDGEDVSISKEAQEDLRLKAKRKFIIGIERGFYPKHKIEEFTTKLVVKKRDAKAVLDFYVSAYQQQFNRRQILFLNEVEKIKNGLRKSDIIEFDSVNFIAFNSYGSDDLKYYEFNNLEFLDVVPFDGNYVIKFLADFAVDADDLIEEFYDPIAARKCENHEKRENAVISLDTALEIMNRDNYDADKAIELIKEMDNGNGTNT